MYGVRRATTSPRRARSPVASVCPQDEAPAGARAVTARPPAHAHVRRAQRAHAHTPTHAHAHTHAQAHATRDARWDAVHAQFALILRTDL